MFEACLALPNNPREARLIAETLESLARALREWPVETWRTAASKGAPAAAAGLFERLVARVAPLTTNPAQRSAALESAEAAAAVLRCLWPEAQPAAPREAVAALATA